MQLLVQAMDSFVSAPQNGGPIPVAPSLLNFDALSAYVSFGRSRIYQQIAAGEFPQPIKVGKSSRWVKAEVDAWINRHCAQRAEA